MNDQLITERDITMYWTVMSVFMAIFLCSPFVLAADWSVSPRLSITESYDTNVLFSQDQKIDDFVTYVQPAVSGTYRTRRLDVTLDAALGIEKYIQEEDLDTVDEDYRGSFTYALFQTLGLTLGGFFRKDTSLETELAEAGLLVNREDRRRYGGNVGLNYTYSPRLSFSGAWYRSYIEYPDNPSDLQGYRSDSLDFIAQYILTPRNILTGNVIYSVTDYDPQSAETFSITDRSITNYTFLPAFRHYLAETSYIFGGIGYRYTESEFKIVQKPPFDQIFPDSDISERTDGFIYDFGVHKDWKKGSWELTAGRDQYSSLEGISFERDRIAFSGTYQLSDRFVGSGTASYSRNRSDEEETDDDREYFTLSPAVSYRWTPNITLRGSVNYSKYLPKNDDDTDRFRSMLILDITWPRFFSGS
jgi:hypothetical protein